MDRLWRERGGSGVVDVGGEEGKAGETEARAMPLLFLTSELYQSI